MNCAQQSFLMYIYIRTDQDRVNRHGLATGPILFKIEISKFRQGDLVMAMQAAAAAPLRRLSGHGR
jgi:hypothetical protein